MSYCFLASDLGVELHADEQAIAVDAARDPDLVLHQPSCALACTSLKRNAPSFFTFASMYFCTAALASSGVRSALAVTASSDTMANARARSSLSSSCVPPG